MIDIREEWKRETGYTIRDVDSSADGEYIIVGSFDYKVYLFDRKGTLLWSYKTGDTVRDVAISFDGRYMAAGSYDNCVYFFNTNGDLLWKYRTGAPVRDVSISAGGENIVVGSNDKYVHYLNKEGKLLWKYPTRGSVFSVALSTRGEYISAGSNDRNIYFFNKLGDLLWNYETGSAVRDVEMTTKGKYIAVGSYDHHLYFFDKSGKLLWKRERKSPIVKVAISPQGDEIATGGMGEVSLYDQNGVLQWSHNSGEHEIRGLEISTKGGSIICGSRDNELLYFDMSGRLLWRYRTSQWVETVAVGSRGRFISAGLRNGLLYLFDSLEFFKQYLEEARQSIVKLENLGSEAGKARTLYDEAMSHLYDENYLEALALAIRSRSTAERSSKKHKPILSYIVETDKAFKANTWIPIQFRISNSGRADCRDVLIKFHGPVRLRGERRIEVLKADDVKNLKMEIRPLYSGTQDVGMTIAYFDNSGRDYSISETGEITVHDWLLEKGTQKGSTPSDTYHTHEGSDRGFTTIFKRLDKQQIGSSPLLRTEQKCPNCNRNVKTDWIACPYCAASLK